MSSFVEIPINCVFMKCYDVLNSILSLTCKNKIVCFSKLYLFHLILSDVLPFVSQAGSLLFGTDIST
jgi:hypothetical protein